MKTFNVAMNIQDAQMLLSLLGQTRESDAGDEVYEQLKAIVEGAGLDQLPMTLWDRKNGTHIQIHGDNDQLIAFS